MKGRVIMLGEILMKIFLSSWLRTGLNIGCLFVFALFSACQKKSTDGSYGLDPQETLRIVISTEPPSLDWNKSSDTSSSFVTDNIMEGLVNYDFSGSSIGLAPGLATKWSSSEGSRKWVFTIRKGVKWIDGVDFTPQHIVDGWERLLNPQTASVYAYFLFSIRNAEAYNKGTLKDFSQVGVRVSGDQLYVELVEPTNFPFLMTHHSTFPVRKDVVAQFGNRWTEAKNIVTLGAYRLKIWDHDRALVLERSENYFGSKAKTKNVLAQIIEEEGTAINLFKSGRIDALTSLPASMLRVLKKMSEYKERASLVTYYFGFNTQKPPMDDVNLRKAIVLAVDRSQITSMLNGGQEPLSGWIPRGMLGYDKNAGLTFNLKKAQEYYKKAGFSKDQAALPFVLAYNTNENHKRIAENIQAQLKKNLGLRVEIKNEEWKVYLGTLRSNTPHMYRMGWVADYPDPHNFYELMKSTSENNHTGWKDPQYDQFLKKAAESVDQVSKLKFYERAQKNLLEEAVAVLPIYSGVDHNLISSRVKNFPSNAMSRYILKDVEIQKP